MVVIETRHSKIYCEKGVRFFATGRNYCNAEIIFDKQAVLWDPIFTLTEVAKGDLVLARPLDTITDLDTGVVYLIREMWGDP